MGTLFEQPSRVTLTDEYCTDEMITVLKTYQDAGYSKDQSIEIMKVHEMRKSNWINLNDGDIKDEQLMGFGELLKELIKVLRK